MSDAEYKQLTPEQLMMYNKTMPEMDYSKQYARQDFPKAKYQLRELPGGGRRLVSVEVANREAEQKLVGDWRDTPADWGIITHPAADPVARETGFSFDVPDPIEPQVASDGLPLQGDEPEQQPVREPDSNNDGEGTADATARPTRRR